MLPMANSLSMEMMSYKPPVQTSVSKLRNSRLNQPKQDQPPASRSTTSKSSAAVAGLIHHTADAIDTSSLLSSSSSSSGPSFEDRMRGLVMGGEQRRKIVSPSRTRPETASRHLPSNVVTVETLAEYKTVVGDEPHKVVAVRFYAPWCKACRAVAPLFYHMANKFPNVKFVDVPVTEQNANLHQGLGVPSLPFGHIYHPHGGLVEEVRMSRKFIPQFATKLQSYVSGSCDLQGVGVCTSPYKEETDD